VSAAQVQRHRAPGTTDDLARRLRRCRVDRAGISQAELAGLVKVSRHRIQHIEHGDSLPTTDEVSAWVFACGCTCQASELLAMAGARQPVAIDLGGGDA
jgi:DNA-binding XRE family transcriptional regulator